MRARVERFRAGRAMGEREERDRRLASVRAGFEDSVATTISTSGNSRNVLEAVAVARQRGLATIGLCGRGGGKLAGCVDVPIVVPSDRTPRIQETHIAIIHVLCELVEDALFPASFAQ